MNVREQSRSDSHTHTHTHTLTHPLTHSLTHARTHRSRPDRVVAIGRVSASALISADTAFVWVKLHAPVAPSDTNTTEDEGAAGAPIGNFGDNNDGGEGEVDCSIGEIQLQLQDVDEREAPTQQMQAKAHGGGKVERAMRRGVEREMGRRATSSHRDWRLKKVRDA